MGAASTLPFIVHSVEGTPNGHTLHRDFEANAEIARVIERLLQRHGHQSVTRLQAA